MTTRNWIDKNIILKVVFPKKALTLNAKKKTITDTFKSFLELYTLLLRKKNRRFPKLKLDTSHIEYIKGKPSNFIGFMFTQPYNNHPFLVYGDLINNYFNIIIPLGGTEMGQIGSNELIPLIKYFTKYEKLLIMLLLNRTIDIRRKNLTINAQFSLYKCENIRMCRAKLREINRNNNLTRQQKNIEINNLQKMYEPKVTQMLSTYFRLLSEQKYDEALMYLKGSKTNRNIYYNKQRLNTFFMASRKIIGHLQVFINLYKLNDIVKKSL